MRDNKYQFRVLRKIPEQKAIFDWWIGMEHRKGERAELRRCQNGEDALPLIGFFRLRYQLPEDLHVSDSAIASVASILSHLKPSSELLDLGDIAVRFDKMMADCTVSLATELGEEATQGSQKTGRAIFSELRFQRLNQSASQGADQDFDVQMRRAVRQAQSKNSQINPVIVADHIFYRYRALKNPERYMGNKKFEFLFAKDYYQQVFTYQKDDKGN